MNTNTPTDLPAAQTLLGDLPATDLPATLLPVRLETRFITQEETTYLCVRVFPDDVHIDTHEPELTEDEERWGRHLWAQVWQSGHNLALEQALQDELAERFGPGRAAWIAKTLKPLNPEDRPKRPLAAGEAMPELVYPTVARRPASWTKAPRMNALPDRWVVLGYRQGERVLTAVGNPILDSLTAGPDPSAPPPETLSDPTVLPVDDGMRWMVDFEEAVQVGMGLRIPLDSLQAAETGYDRLLAMGLNASLGGAASANVMESLLISQRYTDSLAFVPQGTPSNNTAESTSGYSVVEPDQATDFLSRRPTGEGAPDGNGPVTARALGVETQLFDQLPHAADQEQADARAMNTALWPASWGYFLRYGMGGLLSDEQLEQTRQHFRDFVRGRGPLPVLRVGRQPYGILPVTTLERYQPTQADLFGAQGIQLLRTLRDRWQQSLPQVPKVEPLDDAAVMAQTLADILGMQPTSAQVLARLAFDGAFYGLFSPTGLATPTDSKLQTRRQAALASLRAAGIDVGNGNLPVAQMALTELNQQLTAPFVESADSLSMIREATFADLRSGAIATRPGQQTLFLLLRHAMLLAYADVTYRIQVAKGVIASGPHADPGLVDILSDEVTAVITLKRLLDSVESTLAALGADERDLAQSLTDMRDSLDHLSRLSEPQLDLLLRETLDLASHRLDAWMTSLATARLHQLRQKQPKGMILGGYGWVENLRMDQRAIPSPSAKNDTSPLFERTDNGGYVAAPSLNQAATAAILRSGYLNHGSQEATDPFAINLSSERVRLAQWLLEGVRQGQALGTLLGYRFERGLKENNLADFIEPFRKIAPLGELYRLLADIEDAENALKALKDQQKKDLQAAQKTLSDRNKERNQTSGEIGTINGQIGQKQSRLTTLNRNHPNIPGSIAALKQEKEPLVRRQTQLSRDLDRLHPNSPFRKAIVESYQKVSSQISKINRQIRDLEALQAEKERLPEEIKGLTTEKNGLIVKLDEAQRQVDSQQAIVNGLPAQQAQARQPYEARLEAAKQAHEDFLQAYRDRYLYPPSASIEAIEAIEVQHGVDGLALMKLWQADNIPFGRRGLPNQTSRKGQALQAQLDNLVAMVDAVSDLVTAEGLFQLTQGNDLRAGATLDAIAKGETPPPAPEVITTPRSGIAHTHRLAVVLPAELPAESTSPAGWATDSFQRRAETEPALNHWLADLLPDPARVRIETTYVDPHTHEPLAQTSSRLSNFQLSPLDVIYIATLTETGTGSPLELQMAYRLLRLRPSNVPAEAAVRFSYKRAPDWADEEVSLGTFLEVARAARELITAARPLDARDLSLPEDETLQPQVDRTDLKRRADTAVNHLNNARRLLETAIANAEDESPNLDELRASLTRLFYLGFSEAVPRSPQGNEETAKNLLLEQAIPLLAEANRRFDTLDTLSADFDRRTADPTAQIELDVKRLQTVYGADFRVLPRFQPVRGDELSSALDNSLSLQGQDPLAAVTWLDQMAHVRDGSQRLHTCLTYAEALKPEFAPSFVLGQLPYTPGDRWVGLSEDISTDSSRTAIVTLIPSGFPQAVPLVGLMVDDWVETIPNAQEMAGVAFHFDAPQAQTPHAILLAVPPDDAPRWTLETLEAIVQETLDLAKLRAVDNAALFEEDTHGQLLPALYLAMNPDGDTVSTDFSTRAVNIGAPVEPRLSRISPSSGTQGRIVNVTLEGLLLAETSAISFSGSGITTRRITVVNDTQLRVELSISSNATPGRRTFRVTTPRGVLQSQTFNLDFTVRKASRPKPRPRPPHYGSFGRSVIGGDLL
ncbi:MAG: hypothetical protein AAFV72_09415 [Cyanobacteria bacterium J06635_1]